MSSLVDDINGFILAGGDSRRFGRDKRLFDFNGVTLLERARRLLREFTGDEPFLVGDNLDGIVAEPNRIIRDARPGCGPLGGLVSALDASTKNWCLVVAVDLPRLSLNDLGTLAQAKHSGLDVITLSRTGDPEPLAALYHRNVRRFWARRLQNGDLSLVDGIRRLVWKPVMIRSGNRALENLNKPSDLGS